MKKTLGILLALSALTSCSSYSLVNSDVYNSADLSQYRTFRIVTPDDGTMPPGMTSVTYYNIAAAIREQLVERGYTEDPTSPILVNIGLTVKKEVAYQAFTTPGVWVTPPPAWGTPVIVGPAAGPNADAQNDVPIMPQTDPGLAAPPQGSGLYFNNNTPAGQGAEQPQNPQPAPSANEPQNIPAPAHVPPIGPAYNGLVPFYMYPRGYYMSGTTQIVPSVYREGVLSMDIVDIQTKTPLYSSSVATILDNGDTQFRNLSGIAQAVKVLFSKFPVPIQAQYK